MKLNPQKPRNFINPLLSRKPVDAEKFNTFKLALAHYKKSLADQIATKQTEPNIVTNSLKPFLDSFGYQSEPYSQKGQISIDLAVMQNLKPSVIIEAKMPNSGEMIEASGLNKKSFRQAIMYFMNERAKDNKALFHIIVTDFNNWFVFDAKDFDRIFWRNSSIKKLHEALTTQALLGDRTEDFYRDLEKILPTLKKDLLEPEEIDCAHFNIQQPAIEKELLFIYKLLSADCLLKEFNPNDANSLNNGFYNELLYILGLEETKEKGKKVIGKATLSQAGTLYENTANKLKSYNKGQEPEFEAVIKLIIIWINRILFLKLLESQIVKWTDNKNKFITPDKVNEYDDLETLFFEVLAKPINKRSFEQFNHIPYLNSSLFEPHADESNFKISNLTDGLEINYYRKTVVKDNNQQQKTGKVSTLPYLLAFLDAYDFTNDSGDDVVTQSKDLISASVLGLIFEKINGYKDGSFYTPSFITMYMARESITRTVIAKFNAAFNWRCETLTDLINKDNIAGNAAEVAASNAIIDNIKICDPAVGSGHFLVSALNEILYIKSALKILVDDKGERINEYNISVENDELILKAKAGGALFEYQKGDSEKTRVQKTLFKEKQKIIENCLFGVDINPNSVNICRLRLWIELLKNAYYKADGALDTLPNIDINIKCGNSLISRFGLADDLDSKTIKAEIQDYKDKVKQYKENIGSKRDVLQAIDSIKAKIHETLNNGHFANLTLLSHLNKYVPNYGYDDLPEKLALIAYRNKSAGIMKDMFGGKNDDTAKNKLLQAALTAWKAVEEIESGKIYQNAFEWRFEFPEVLNEEGNFVGFDVVIGNPPYFNIDAFGAGTPMLRYFPEHYADIYMDKSDILFYFIALANKISAKQTAFIISNALLFSVKAQKLRNVLLANNPIRKIINFEKYRVFDEASVTSMMLFLDKSHAESSQVKNFTEANYDKALLVTEIEQDDNFINIQFSEDSAFALVNDSTAALNQKIDSNYPKLGSILHVGSGMQTAANEVYSFDTYPSQFDSQFLKKRMDGEISERYTHKAAQAYLLYIESVAQFDDLTAVIQAYLTTNKAKLENRAEIKRNKSRMWWKYSFPMHKEQYQKDKIWCSYRAKDNTFCLDETNDFIGLTNTTVIFDTNPEAYSIKYVLALLNSKLLNYRYKSIGKQTGNGVFEYFENQVSQLPIPTIELDNQQPFAEKVDAIIAAKQNNTDTSQLEAELDAMVYALYGLSDDEIKLIEH